jgi:hypothetical protein
MENPERQVKWVLRLFLAIGVGLLVVGAVAFVRTAQFVAEAERATGTVIYLSGETDSEGDVLYHPVVSFTTSEAETVQFVSAVGSSPPSAEPGDRVDVLYDPDDPYDAKLSGFFDLWFSSGVLGILGGMFIGIPLFIRHRTGGPSRADIDWLRRHGRLISGRSPRVIHDTTIDVMGSSPFRVAVDVHDPGRNEVRVLSSRPVWFDPGPFIGAREAIDVYIDPNRPERYLVDLSFLPRAGPDHAEK